jgi:hypothetical protein
MLTDEYQMDVGSHFTAVSSTLLLWCGLSATPWVAFFLLESTVASRLWAIHGKPV